jgi:integrase
MNTSPKRYRYGRGGTLVEEARDRWHGYFRAVLVKGGPQVQSPKVRGSCKREVMDKLDAWQRAGGFETIRAIHAAQQNPSPVIQTVEEYLKAWWDAASPRWAPQTRQTDSYYFRKYLTGDSIFNELPFGDSLRKADVQGWLSRFPESASEGVRAYALRVLGRAFGAAVKDERLTRNPARDLANAPRRTTKEAEREGDGIVRFFPSDEEGRLMQFVHDRPEWDALLRFAFDSGCRQGEIFGVRVEDFDFGRGEVFIRRTVDTLNGAGAVPKPGAKTRSIRRILLAPSTLGAVAALLGPSVAPTAPVFVNPAGRLWDRTSFRAAWIALLKAAEVPHLPFHATRHTCATRLLVAGVSVLLVSRRLGHSTPTMTLNVYGHCLPEDQAQCASVYDRTIAAYLGERHLTLVPAAESRTDLGREPESKAS